MTPEVPALEAPAVDVPAADDPATPALLRFARRLPRPVVVALAAATVIVGVILLIRPTTALGVLALLIGAGLVLAGLLELLFPVTRGDRIRMLLAAALVVTGIVVLVLPGLTVRALAIFVGVTLIVRGAVGFGTVLLGQERTVDRRVAEVLTGVAAIALGVLAMVWPDITLLVVAVVFGAALAIAGVAALLRMLSAHRTPRPVSDSVARRWIRTISAVIAVLLAAGAVIASVTLREGTPVVDDFYAAPRTVPDEPGRLIRAEPFTRAVPTGAVGWRVLYTTTHGDDSPAVASGLVVAPASGADHPVIAWHHGTTGYDRACAPSLAPEPFESGAMFVLDQLIGNGWAFVATDYVGLGTEGPHPYMVGDVSGRAELDAVRAARELEDAQLGEQTVAWGHSQGGGASLWSAAIAEQYAPDVPLDGVVALAPASDLPALVEGLSETEGGSVFAAFVISAYSALFPDVSFDRYVRAGAQVTVREMAKRCLAEPATLVSVLALIALKDDPDITASDPSTGPLGQRLKQNVPPAVSAVPILIGQGSGDEIVHSEMQSGYVTQLCGEGASVDFRAYGGLGHLSLVESGSPAIEEAIAWTRDRFAGAEARNGCV